MLSRLDLLLLLPAAACASSEDRAASALTEALAASRASLTAVGSRVAPSPPGLRPATPDPAALERLAVAPGAGAVRSAPPFAPGTSPLSGRNAPPQRVMQLLGATPDGVRQWLGEPSLRRSEGTAEVWLYVAADCALDLILYRDRSRLLVAHAGGRAQGTAVATEAQCLAGIASRLPPTAAGPGERRDGG